MLALDTNLKQAEGDPCLYMPSERKNILTMARINSNTRLFCLQVRRSVGNVHFGQKHHMHLVLELSIGCVYK